jgi:hypothetical protein
MPRVFLRTFRESAPATWIRFDGEPAGDDIKIIFNAAHVEIDVDGIRATDARPMAWAAVSDAHAIAPGRIPYPDRTFDNKDRLVIGSVSYDIESCRADGYGMCEITLHRKIA